MEHTKNKQFNSLASGNLSRKGDRIFRKSALVLLMIWMLGCSDFVEVDPPKNVLVSETVFDDPETVESTLANIYHRLREQGLVSGNFGTTTGMGIYSDELDYYGFDTGYLELYNHTVLPANNVLLAWWSHAYNIIYSANDILKGIEGSGGLSEEEKDLFKGQALFVRAYMHGLLVPLFGEIPYIKTTDYLQNNMVSRMPVSEVYGNIIADLEQAVGLLEGTGEISGERVVPDQYAAKALLARMYLYTENWGRAASTATELINIFALETDLRDVFLKDSRETIWQLKPGENPKNTQEANQLIIQFVPGQTYALTEALLSSFEAGDLRRDHWVGSTSDTDSTVTLYFAHKYKATLQETESVEYSILFRLAEQYLIRAEARAHLGNLAGARQDLNKIRNRAGLSDSTADNMNDLLGAILRERQVELFTEQGHRWVDLKRTGRADEVLAPLKPNWIDTDTLLPVPEAELEINPNLLPQNPGY